MNKSEFTELAYNDHRTALLTLWGLYETATAELAAIKAEHEATQATVLELAAAVNAPVEE